jgi:transcription initiation factor IIE alpha subunit
MATKATSMRLTMKEMVYLLFKKKSCPHCGGMLVKEKCSKIINGTEHFTKARNETYLKREEVKMEFYKFTCDACGHTLTIGDTGDVPTHLQ